MVFGPSQGYSCIVAREDGHAYGEEGGPSNDTRLDPEAVVAQCVVRFGVERLECQKRPIYIAPDSLDP